MKKAINFQGGYTDTSLIDYLKGSSLETAVCWKLTPKMPVRGPLAVTWQNVVGLAAGANTLACAFTGVGGWGSHGASSVQTFTDQGELRFRWGCPSGDVMCGLSSDDASRHFNDIDFAWYLWSPSSLVQIYEGGTLRASFSDQPRTAIFAVKRLWDYTLNRYKIVYTIDDEIKYTSALTPATTLRVDTAFSPNVAGSVVDVMLTQSIAAIGATSHTQDLTLPGHAGVTFKSSGGGVPTTIDTEAGHESAGLQVESVFDDAAVTEQSVDAGDWAGAKFEIFTVVPKTLSMGQLVEFSGRLGRVETEGQGFRAEARPLTAVAQAQVGRLATAKCDVKNFADKFKENRCKLDPTVPAADGGAITVTGAVTAADKSTEFTDSARAEGANYFTFGEVRFTTGPLAGRRFEVREYDSTNKKFVLRRAAPVRIGVGWAYEAIRGCDRTSGTCEGTYANIINYRGEKFITNVEQINKIRRAS